MTCHPWEQAQRQRVSARSEWPTTEKDQFCLVVEGAKRTMSTPRTAEQNRGTSRLCLTVKCLIGRSNSVVGTSVTARSAEQFFR